MTKAEKYKEHSDLVRLEIEDGKEKDKLWAQVLTDGTCRIDGITYTSRYSGISPSTALRLGEWLIDMYGEEK